LASAARLHCAKTPLRATQPSSHMRAMSTSPQSKHAVSFVFIVVLIDMMGFGLIMPVLPRLIEEVGQMSLSDASIIGGWLFFVYGAAQFVVGPAIGNLSDAYGRRPIILLSVVGQALDFLMHALAPTLLWLFAARLVSGFCGASYTTANAYIADITAPEARAKAFGLMGAAFGLGFILGPALGGLLGEFGPRVPFYAAAALCVANAIYGYFILPETLPREKRRPFELMRANPFGLLKVFATYRGVLQLALVMFIYFLASAVYPAIWPFWAIARFGWSEAMIGLSLAAFGLVTAICQGMLTGPAVKRFGERKAALIGLFCAIIGVVGYGLAGGIISVIILMILHAPEGFVHPALAALMSNQAPEDAQGELQGGISSLQNLAMVIGTVIFSQVFGFFTSPAAPFQSTGMAFFVSGALLTIVLIAFVAARKTKSTAR
jgi:MFS transporter, DHA1 family, tetracycline resistance protein